MMRFRKGDGERSGLFSRRTLLLGGAQAVLMSALAGRLYQLQVLETQRFATLAEENRINLRLLPPSRGLIFDRTGQPLAVNRNNFRAMVTGVEVVELKHEAPEAAFDEGAAVPAALPASADVSVR